jgi:hypothetical protein
MDMGGYEKIDFNKVLKVLEDKGCDHGERGVLDACFRRWGKGFDFGSDYEEVVAYLIRLALVDEVIKFVKRLLEEGFDMRDILLFLVVRGMGLGFLSQVVEAAERGLRVVYDEKSYEFLGMCLEVMMKSLEEKMSKMMKEVVLQ